MRPEAAYRQWLASLPTLEAVRAEMVQGVPEAALKYMLGDDAHTLRLAQRGQCATCAASGRTWTLNLVCDHDHRTGLVRGWLCRSCNGVEAHTTHELFGAYRAWPPAAHFGIRERYRDATAMVHQDDAPQLRLVAL